MLNDYQIFEPDFIFYWVGHKIILIGHNCLTHVKWLFEVSTKFCPDSYKVPSWKFLVQIQHIYSNWNKPISIPYATADQRPPP